MSKTPITAEGVQKAVAAFIVSVASLVGFFVAVDPDTVETILAVTAAVVNVGAVYQTRNKPVV
jgi:hypothetical protein